MDTHFSAPCLIYRGCGTWNKIFYGNNISVYSFRISHMERVGDSLFRFSIYPSISNLWDYIDHCRKKTKIKKNNLRHFNYPCRSNSYLHGLSVEK